MYILRVNWTEATGDRSRQKINIYILSIFLKQHNFLIILIVILSTTIMSTRRNLHLKSTIYEKSVENELPC